MLNRTMCLSMVLLSSSLLFTIPTATKTPLANNIKEDANVNKILKTDKYGLLINPIQEQFEKHKLELEKKKAEENKQLEEQKKNKPQWQEFELTFYSSLPEENNGIGTKSVTCTGGKLYDGLVASNYYKLNTQIQLEGWGTVTVGDRGSNKYFNNDYRLDVYIPKEHGESDSHYFSRVNKMGRIKVKGTILK